MALRIRVMPNNRPFQDDRNYLCQVWRLLSAESRIERAAARTERTPRQIRPYAAGVPSGTPPDTVRQIAFIRAAVLPFARDRRSGAEQIRVDTRPRDGARNHNRGIGLRLTEITPLFPLLVQRDRRIPPQSVHAPTAQGRSFTDLFYSARHQNSIPKGAGLCRAI